MTTKKENTKELVQEMRMNDEMLENAERILSDLGDTRNTRYGAYSELIALVGGVTKEIYSVLGDAQNIIDLAPINKRHKRQLSNLLNGIAIYNMICLRDTNVVTQQENDGSLTLSIDYPCLETRENRVKRAEAVKLLVNLHSLLTNYQPSIFKHHK